MPKIADVTKAAEFMLYRPTGGQELTPEVLTKAVDENGVSSITFFKKDARNFNKVTGYLEAKPLTVADKDKLATVLDAATAPTDVAQLADWVTKQLDAKKAYLFPAFDPSVFGTRYKYNNIIGQRVDQTTRELVAIARNFVGTDGEKAFWVANAASRDLMNREVVYDDFEINGYASFGHDATFLHVYEAKLKAIDTALADEATVEFMGPGYKASLLTQKPQLQAEIDAIFRDKYVFHNDAMQETNAEHAIGLACIDVKSRQRVSEVEGSRKTLVPQFEIINTPAPDGRAVFFDAKASKYFFDGTNTEIPADAVATLVRKALNASEHSQISFRRAMPDEPLRDGFRYDWNGDGYVQNDIIDWVSWGGHCNDKAALEAAGLVIPQSHTGVYEFDAASGTTRKLTPNLLNDALMSFSEFKSALSNGPKIRADMEIGKTEFAAARDDDRADKITLGNGREIPLGARGNKFNITEVTVQAPNRETGKVETQTLKAEDAFREHLLGADNMSATKNPLFQATTEGDYISIKLGKALIKADIEVQVFDESGYPTMDKKSIELDFNKPPTAPILVDSQIDPQNRQIFEIYLGYDQASKTWNWSYKGFEMQEQADGKFKKVETNPGQSEPFDPARLTAKRETSLDNPATWLPFVQHAMASGQSGTGETALDSGVWNGRLKTLAQSLEKRVMDADGKGGWELVNMRVEARYGGNPGQYLARLNAKGEAEYFVPVAAPADFFWRQQIVFASTYAGKGNSTALDRGVITQTRTAMGKTMNAEALNDMLQVLHCAFNNQCYTIVGPDGKRYSFADKASWEAQVKAFQDLRRAALGVEAPAPQKLVAFAQSGHVDNHGEVNFGPIEIPEDGVLSITMRGPEGSVDQEGDADLYVSKKEGFTRDSAELRLTSGSVKEDGELTVKAGEKVYLKVYGYSGSVDFAVNARSLTADEIEARELRRAA